MNEKIISLIIVLSLFLMAREGFQLRDKVEPSKALSSAWHSFGWFMRLMVTGLMFQASGSWLLTLLIVLLLWPMYNIACNVGLKKKWYYLSDSGIDKYIRKLLPKIKFDK